MHPAIPRRIAIAIGVTFMFVIASAVPFGLNASGSGSPPPPSVTFGTTTVLEWDLPAQMDLRPGAMTADPTDYGSRLWFVTRLGEPASPRLYRFDVGAAKKSNNATWSSWELAALQPTSGVRKIKAWKDKRQVFIRTATALQRIDTGDCKTTLSGWTTVVTCKRTLWDDRVTVPVDPANAGINPLGGSDLTIDDLNNVYSTVSFIAPGGGGPDDIVGPDSAGTPSNPIPGPVPPASFIEHLNPNSDVNNVVRWYVGGGVGSCTPPPVIPPDDPPDDPGPDLTASITSAPCLSGIVVNPWKRHLVYYSEPTGGPDSSGAISELNTYTSIVRRWSFADLKAATGDLTIKEPRQLQFDSDGVLWAVTGSGHLVSLDPRCDRMSKHAMPDGATNDPFGVAPDGGAIGYTSSNITLNKVAMLIPGRDRVTVSPVCVTVVNITYSIPGVVSDAPRTDGVTPPKAKIIDTRRTTNADGTFVEGFIGSNGNDSQLPLGITPDLSACVGTFYYAVGHNLQAPQTNRIGRIRLPRSTHHGRVERDDDDKDDDGKRADDDDDDDDGIKNVFDGDDDNDGVPDISDEDDDDDGIEDDFDSRDRKEGKQTSSQDVAAGNDALDEFTLNPGTLLAVVSAVSSDVLSPVSVEILNEAGQVVASSLPSPGASVLTWVPPVAGGIYTVRAKNRGLGAATVSTKVLTRALWP